MDKAKGEMHAGISAGHATHCPKRAALLAQVRRATCQGARRRPAYRGSSQLKQPNAALAGAVVGTALPIAASPDGIVAGSVGLHTALIGLVK
jgi:hypothetical protein